MRNFKKENEWAKTKYERINSAIDKKIGQELKETLKKEKISLSNWLHENANKYLELHKNL